MYNFGSPRVGNKVFAENFDAMLQDGRIDQAYRIVNGDDIVTRVPRTTNAIIGRVDYDHVGSTVLVSTEAKEANGTEALAPALWIEGESDDAKCPVRDMDFVFNNPMAAGTLLGDILGAVSSEVESEVEKEVEKVGNPFDKFTGFASKVSDRLKKMTASDVASIIGVDREFSEREFKIIESFTKGKALANHMEDDYYSAMGRACGLIAAVGEEITAAKS